MIKEIALIPYSPSKLPFGPWIIFAPHPDDETFGMGGSIALAEQIGIDVYVVVMTDGSQGGEPETRKQEILAAAKILGIKDVFFLEFADRSLCNTYVSLEKIASHFDHIKPQSVFLPHPQEFHPDHRATTFHLYNFLRSILFVGQIWLYEISRQSEINRLMDISSVLEVKKRAIECFASQIEQHNYKDVVLSLNKARTYTLDSTISFAEGFWVVTDLNNLYQDIKGHIHNYFSWDYADNPLISVIVRTMNRPQLLAEALQSIADQSVKDIETVVVCDGGEDVTSVLDSFRGLIQKIKYIRHEYSRGRAAAANTGLKNASGTWIAFLDDDDLLEPKALQNHVDKVKETRAKIVYGRVVREHYTQDGRKKADMPDYIYNRPFDKQLLFLQNYIPLISLFVYWDVFSHFGMFDETLPINEDWDFLIRAAQENKFVFHDSLVARYRCFGSSTVIDGRLGENVVVDTEYRVRKRWWEKLSPEVIDSFRQYVAQETEKSLNQEINRLNQRLYNLEQEKRSLYKSIKQLEQTQKDNEFQKSQLELMRNSFSWKSTAPLRCIRHCQMRIASKITASLQKKNWK